MEVIVNILALLTLPIIPISFIYSLYLKGKEGGILILYPLLLLVGYGITKVGEIHPSISIVAFLSSLLYGIKLLSADSFNTFIRFLFFSTAGIVLALGISSIPYVLSFTLLILVERRIRNIYETTSFRLTGGLLDLNKSLAYVLLFAYTPFVVFYTFTLIDLVQSPIGAFLFSLVNLLWTAAFGKLFREVIGLKKKGVLR